MRIALCSYSQKEKETALLMKLGKVDRFDNGVFCTYAMQRDGPYDAVVVMEDGARGMNFCMSIRSKGTGGGHTGEAAGTGSTACLVE